MYFTSNKFLSQNPALYDNVAKYNKALQATDHNITQRMRFAYLIIETRKQTHTLNMQYTVAQKERNL